MKNMTLERITEVCGGVKERNCRSCDRQQTGRVRISFYCGKGRKGGWSSVHSAGV